MKEGKETLLDFILWIENGSIIDKEALEFEVSQDTRMDLADKLLDVILGDVACRVTDGRGEG